MDHQNKLNRWITRATADPDLPAELNQIKSTPAAIADRFYRDLTFGTGGLRGVIGAGTNRMNIYTVRRATQGLAEYLNASGLPRAVAIAHDSRNKGELFARESARVLAANGITTYLYPRLEPTPALSWAVRYFGCGAGICITASHNPAKYNGYKVYGADGCQITPQTADAILAQIKKTDCFDDVKLADFDAALADGRIRWIGDECLDAFVDAVLGLRTGVDVSGLRLVYTPLNGSGLECVKKLLAQMGVPDENITVVPAQEKPDGNFSTCPYPNPEIREAMEEGLRLCDAVHPDLLLGTDPDCDRMGAAVPDGAGGYRLLTGNEMGALLLDYLCKTRLANGTMPTAPVAVTTVVSTDLATPIAKKHGVELRHTLTGFKYIGEQIGALESAGEAERYLFGFEESYGYLSGTHVRDKDAVNAVMLACEAAAWYAGKGMNLLDALKELYAEFGFYRNALRSFAFEGETGMKAMQDVMGSLRARARIAGMQSMNTGSIDSRGKEEKGQSPESQSPGNQSPEDQNLKSQNTGWQIAGITVERTVDYQNDETGLPRENMLEFRLENGSKLIVRPSGTEPKMKVYLSATGASEAKADAMIIALSKVTEEMMKKIPNWCDEENEDSK